MMKVVLVESGKTAKITEIGESLKELQEIVGGPIEVIPFEDALIVANEEGKIRELALNRAIKNGNEVADVIAGTFFICRENEGDFASLDDGEAAYFKHVFYYPEVFSLVDGKFKVESVGKLQKHFKVTQRGVNTKKLEFVFWPHRYAMTYGIALEAYLYNKADNTYESYDFITTCLPGAYMESENTICVNADVKYGIDWNKVLKRLHLVSESEMQVGSGFNTYNVYELDMERLGDICGDEAMELLNEQSETEVEDEEDL